MSVVRPDELTRRRPAMPAAAEQQEAAAAAGDSITVATWTIVSRVTGVAKFAAIGAVLGPTFFGNTYQFTNSLPNLVYYGFLAGSLFSSLLVPALVRHIDAGDRGASQRVAGGFLGMTLVALVVIAPVAILLGPVVLRFATLGGAGHQIGAEQAQVGRLLIIMFVPQIFFYGVVGTATAVMNSRQRFALAAGAPAVENLGTIAVLVLTAVIYGTGTRLGNIPPGELLLLGLGSTGAVALHAATQWWGASRAGVRLIPRPGWRDPEVRVVVRRALPSLAQAGLVAFQVLTLLVVANRLPGGVVAFQIALNFYYLAIAVGATPVALSLLPRLARMHLDGDEAGFRDTLVRGLSLGFFITIPAAVGYFVLAVPLARAISFGRMSGVAGTTMVAASLAALSLAVVGQTAFLIATYASYARKDTRTPLISMVLQATICLGLVSIALFVHGWKVLFVLGLALSVAVTVGACHLIFHVWRGLSDRGSQRLAPSLCKILVGAVVMAGPAWLTATAISQRLGRPFGPRVSILAAALVGTLVFLAVQAAWRTPELAWLAGGFGHLRDKARSAAARNDSQLAPSAGAGPRWAAGYLDQAIAPSPALPWRGRGLWFPGSRWVSGPALAGAVTLGVMCAIRPKLTLIVVLGLVLVICVWARPALAAYLIIFLDPLTAGINRGSAVPILRPNEAIALLMGLTLIGRGLVRLRTGGLPKLRLDRLEWALLLMAVTSSFVPLLWMAVRQQPISKDDIEYALVLWKFLGLYAIIRAAVRTERQIKRCMWLSVAAACIVAVLAIVQSLGAFGALDSVLTHYYAPFGNTNAFASRGSSTLGLPAAVADLAIINLAVIAGLWTRYQRHRPVLAAAAGLLILGALSAGEFSSAMGLFAGVICIAVVLSKPRLLWAFVPAALAAGVVLRPVIERRLSGFGSASGLPTSWVGRIDNLQTYFWPRLFSNWNFVMGVEPSARVVVATQATGYVWIESGYTWLLWAGGIPLLLSFVFLVYAAARRGWQAARGGRDGSSVAGIAVFTAIIVITFLMIFDMHLTYRGSGDEFFMLLALAVPRVAQARQAPQARQARGTVPVRRAPLPGRPVARDRAPVLTTIGGRPPAGSGNGHGSPAWAREV
jgi:putative peptidoglycan lipid II flippase